MFGKNIDCDICKNTYRPQFGSKQISFPIKFPQRIFGTYYFKDNKIKLEFVKNDDDPRLHKKKYHDYLKVNNEFACSNNFMDITTEHFIKGLDIMSKNQIDIMTNIFENDKLSKNDKLKYIDGFEEKYKNHFNWEFYGFEKHNYDLIYYIKKKDGSLIQPHEYINIIKLGRYSLIMRYLIYLIHSK